MNAYISYPRGRWTPVLLTVALVGAGTGGRGGTPASPDPVAARPPAIAALPASDAPNAERNRTAAADTIDLWTIGYPRGADDAPILVYEFSDFGCPFCGMFARDVYPGLHEEFVSTGRVRWTYVPIVMGSFPNGSEAARAAECAGEQERFWEMHDRLYAEQKAWRSSRRPEQIYQAYARDLGLDETRFAACYRENGGEERTTINNLAAATLGVRASPTFFINGRLVEGALPAEQFRQLLTAIADERR